MKIKEIREMSDAELAKQCTDIRKESLRLKLQAKTGELKSPARLRQIRRDVARIKTEQTARTAKAAAPAGKD